MGVIPTKRVIKEECQAEFQLIETYILEGLREGIISCMVSCYVKGMQRGWKLTEIVRGEEIEK